MESSVPAFFVENSDGNFPEESRSAMEAQLAEQKIVALQHRSRAKSSQENSLFNKQRRIKFERISDESK